MHIRNKRLIKRSATTGDKRVQAAEVDPIRIALFTGEKCAKCPEVKRIVHRIVGSAMGDSIHVVTIDIDEQPAAAAKHNIMSIPTILIDDKKVLTGAIEEDDIKTQLWETILHRGQQREGIHERKKKSMLQITMNTLNSVTKQELVREDLGDYFHIGFLQQIFLSLLALDPLVRPLFYRVGKDLGMYGALPSFCISANPRISSEYRAIQRFAEIMQGVVNLFSQPTRYPTYTTESAELMEVDSTSALMRVYGSAFSAGVPTIEEPIDFVLAGNIAGMIEVLLGKHVRVEEHNCWGLGARYCDFFIDTAEKPEDLPPSDQRWSEQDPQSRRYLFQDAIIQVTKQMEDSIFMKGQHRKHVGDYCHIGVIQQPLTALKWIDPFCGTLLYSAGFELGIYGPGKEIIWKTMLDLKKEWPLELQDAVKVVTTYLAHPQTILTRQHAFVQVTESNSERALIQIKDCATTSGLPTFEQGEQFCDFQAGYIGGRIDLLTERDVIVREVECHGTGHNHCLFEIVHV